MGTVISYVVKQVSSLEFDWKSIETETTTWPEFPNGGKAIVEQVLVSEERIRVTRGYFRNWGQHPEDTKKGTFSLQKVERDTPNLTSPNVHSQFTIVLKKIIPWEQHPEVILSFSLKQPLVTVRDLSRKVNHLSKFIWNRKIITVFTESISSTRIG